MSLVSEQTFERLWSKKDDPGLRRPRVQFRTYSGEQLQVMGELDVKVVWQPSIFVQGWALVYCVGIGSQR